ncbi:MAG: acyl-CoA synthetase [Pseudomonadota bacterium]
MNPSIFSRAARFTDRTAISDEHGDHDYGRLLEAGRALASALAGGKPGRRVAFLAEPGLEWASTLWGVWLSGGVAVPLSSLHPVPELEYALENSDADVLIGSAGFEDRLRPLARKQGLEFLSWSAAAAGRQVELPAVDVAWPAMILYTSGTTSRPKGAVTTHRQIEAQIASLVNAWEYNSRDRLLHVLPLHHLHGILNALLCPLWVGAAVEMAPRFDAADVWRRIARGGITLFMAVPTVYVRLIAFWENAAPAAREEMSRAAGKLRLMVSGSAALPVGILEKWRRITGQTLLERYGMTEIGMALSNPLAGPRIPGAVGSPLPGVDLRLVGEDGGPVDPGVPGEIQVKAPSVFLEYWRNPAATAAAFTADGWFKTGDIAAAEEGVFRILGRDGVDIIKTGGYKISALEIEEVMRTHPGVEDCAVVGLADPEWGQVSAAAVTPKPGISLGPDELKTFLKAELAPYKIPKRYLLTATLPRNAMGKIVKKAVADMF